MGNKKESKEILQTFLRNSQTEVNFENFKESWVITEANEIELSRISNNLHNFKASPIVLLLFRKISKNLINQKESFIICYKLQRNINYDCSFSFWNSHNPFYGLNKLNEISKNPKRIRKHRIIAWLKAASKNQINFK